MATNISLLNLIGQPFYKLLIFLLQLLTKFHLRPTILIFLLLSIFIYFSIFHNLPNPGDLTTHPPKLTTQILDRNGQLLFKIYKQENRTLVSLNTLPNHVKNAFLAAEDKDFYSHHGFSLSSIIRAFFKNITSQQLEGGSTITQQLIKNTLLTPQRSLIRKIKELVLAIYTEKTYSKDTIFQMYLNQIGFGGPAYGIQEAAQQYFSTNAQDLSLAQASFLAGLTKAPSKYSPFGAHPELAIDRQRFVLDQMLSSRYISQSEYDQAINALLKFSPLEIEIQAPHFVMYVKDILVDQFGENLVNHGGLIVTTSLDLDIQKQFQDFITTEVNRLSNLNIRNGAGIITAPQTGEILAMVGSKDYFNSSIDGNVNLTTASRQPGSAIKPINYALAFELGATPSATINDSPITIHLPGSPPYSPRNYDGKYHGHITLTQALGSSYNIPSVLLATKNGVNNFISLAQKMGITTWDDPSRYGPSAALGSLEVKMTDLAVAYSAFANSGVSTPLTSILSVQNPENKSLIIKKNQPVQVIKSRTAYQITDILSNNNARTPAFGTNSYLNIKKAKVAVKTGTSNDLRDNWTIGYTPNFLVGVWVGNNNNSPMSRVASGVTGASPIWNKTINYLLESFSSEM
ncbi:PBP1A family penicillin-binding protein [Patescibacteria group bacterium]|nr:PBP1A family penicillin-binding protein [Patescibacteria group bacterium]